MPPGRKWKLSNIELPLQQNMRRIGKRDIKLICGFTMCSGVFGCSWVLGHRYLKRMGL